MPGFFIARLFQKAKSSVSLFPGELVTACPMVLPLFERFADELVKKALEKQVSEGQVLVFLDRCATRYLQAINGIFRFWNGMVDGDCIRLLLAPEDLPLHNNTTRL